MNLCRSSVGRSLAAMIALALFLAACQPSPTTNEPAAPAATQGLPAPSAQPSVSAQPQTQVTDQAPKAECLPVFKQTGQGCDQAGVEAALKTLRRPGGPVGKCYRGALNAPREGTVKFRITLSPEGKVAKLETLEDGFPGTTMVGCLGRAIQTLSFPAPGDVPCVVVHTFPFVSEVKSK